ncbi:ABC-type Fe3+/spermidine/putrescine transport system ATPase subunit [Mesorhizobium robiniae]|uniref:ABC-type Fe3+/spermidine/putrescine transport system ATPase subunit n=1 Tax=Mesorhizobium robiniae TaxID=559315 RepID=A0ABV2GKW6_9HYPH
MQYFRVERLVHRFGDFVAIQDISFDIRAGERLCLLGPSGCGKTTTLQAIAGFVTPQSGTISILDEPIDALPPERRNIGIMFQNYALFPHMNVFDNVAFGLKMRKTPRNEIQSRVSETLRFVQLEHKASSMPSQLSGGEQQRVAFARAVVIRPRLLLLDEPFSNLDARLRLAMREELLELLKGLEIATLMVTHDQEEAMAIGDRIAVMRSGYICQIGTPQELYQKPNSRFVGEFLGSSNVFPIKDFRAGTDAIRLNVAGIGEVLADPEPDITEQLAQYLLVRPERIRLLSPSAPAPDGLTNRFDGVLENLTFLGPKVEARIRVADQSVQASSDTFPAGLSLGQPVSIAWSQDASVVTRDAPHG